MLDHLTGLSRTGDIASVLDNLPVGVCLIDEDFQLRLWNATLERWTGQSREETEGLSLLELFPELNHGHFRDQVKEVLVTGTSLEVPLEQTRHFIPARSSRGDQLMTQRTTLSLLSGTQPLVMIVVEEIRVPTPGSLGHDCGPEFISNMTHELRKPLDTIFGYTDFLRDQEDAPERRVAFDGIRRNGERMLTVMSDALDFARIESGQLRTERTRSELRPLLHDIVSLISLNAVEHGIGFQHRIDEEVPDWIQTDPIRLRQILLNLLSNAVVFTEQGQVELNIRLDKPSPQPWLRFDCIDTGVGIPPERIELLFQPFRRTDADLSPRKKGTGLGLAISSHLAAMLGGELSVTSVVGSGSTFSLVIPC